MFTARVTEIKHDGPSPHAPRPVAPVVVKRRIRIAVIDGHAYALKPETFKRI